jgi:thiamine biosynthesis lipoprotein
MTIATAEARVSFPCFGGRVTIAASVPERELIPLRALLESWHRRLTRFDPASELSRLNHDPREKVEVSAIMACFVAAAIDAADRTGGLVDPTLVREIEAAGYTRDLGAAAVNGRAPARGATAPAPMPSRQPAAPNPRRRWRELCVDPATRTVARPRGLMLDSGGIAKGLFADLIAARVSQAASFAIDCCGDVRVGGRAGLPRPVLVDDPFGGDEPLHEFAVRDGGVATSGIGRRTWFGPDGRPRHHLLDPSTGRPAYTGVVQATALAPTAAEAEVLAKAALLSADGGWLAEHGGVLVLDDGSHEVVEPR